MSLTSAPTDKAQGHWLLARLGKKVLRPGGRQLTATLLDSVAIGPNDHVVELAPGVGATAKAILARHPASYTGVDRDAEAAEIVRKTVEPRGGQVLVSPAQHTTLADGAATVVVGEAMLTMQSPANKAAIVAEAARLLGPGGRYAIHELCLLPDNIDQRIVTQIHDDLSRTIHVGAQPLPVQAWRDLLTDHGLTVTAEHRAPMALLSPRRLVADEGAVAAARFLGRVARDPEARARILAMRACFQRWSDHLAAIVLVAEARPQPAA